MAPFAPSAEVYFNNSKSTSAIAAGTFSTTYGRITPGSYKVTFMTAGSTTDTLSKILSDSYDSLRFYTLVLFNRADSSLGSMKINDDFSSLSLSSANYRFFNFCPDAPAVDLVLNTTVVQASRHTVDNEYGGYYNTFSTLTPGGYSVTVKKAGTDSVIASVSSVNLQAGAAYTIFLSGKKNSPANPISVNVLQAAY
ncbi:MAG: DUF4397 domain-containing protein [Chitinophagaceae bacterium]|nr:DUF4397 domain-containing protein [Chitinophagaceae bacterium]